MSYLRVTQPVARNLLAVGATEPVVVQGVLHSGAVRPHAHHQGSRLVFKTGQQPRTQVHRGRRSVLCHEHTQSTLSQSVLQFCHTLQLNPLATPPVFFQGGAWILFPVFFGDKWGFRGEFGLRGKLGWVQNLGISHAYQVGTKASPNAVRP